MSKNKEDKIIKYTIMPKNDYDEYYENFKLSLTEFAKALDGKALLAPLIIYNSDLDIPMDMDESIEEYCIYADKESLEAVIRKQETVDVFRTLIIHGFDIDLDEVRELYCPISRRNQADVCINTIQDLELDNNLTFYLYNDLDKADELEWEETKQGLQQDMQDYINEYKAFENMEDEEFLEMLPFLFGDDVPYDEFKKLFDENLKKVTDDKKEKKKENDKEELKSMAPIPLPADLSKLDEIDEEFEEKIITCSYDYKGYIAINKLGDDLYSIEDDDYEVLLTADQIDFIVQQYNRIKDKK